MIDDHIHHCQHGADGNAQNGTCSADLHAKAHRDPIPCKAQTHQQLEDGLNDLAGGGRHHVLAALGVPTECGHDAYTHHGNTQRTNGPHGKGVVHHRCQCIGAEQHQARTHCTDGGEETQCHSQQSAALVVAAQRPGFGSQLAQCQRQTCRGQGQQKAVDLIGGIEVGHALRSQHIAQRDLIKGADDLHHKHSCGQCGHAAYKGLLFFLFSHERTPRSSRKSSHRHRRHPQSRQYKSPFSPTLPQTPHTGIRFATAISRFSCAMRAYNSSISRSFASSTSESVGLPVCVA